MGGRMKRCSNPACKTKSGRRRRFSSDKTQCSFCYSPLEVIPQRRAIARGSGKVAGKTYVGGRASHSPVVGNKRRRKKQPQKKWIVKKTGGKW
jgi:hypothetical protein